MRCGTETEDLILEAQKSFIKGCEEFEYLELELIKKIDKKMT